MHTLFVTGDYRAAWQLYDTALDRPVDEWPDQQCNDDEIDVWEESRAECFRQLCDWQRLDDISLQARL